MFSFLQQLIFYPLTFRFIVISPLLVATINCVPKAFESAGALFKGEMSEQHGGVVWSQNTTAFFFFACFFRQKFSGIFCLKKKQRLHLLCCFRRSLLCLSFPNDPHIYMIQSTQYIIHLVVEKGSNFAVLFYFFFN